MTLDKQVEQLRANFMNLPAKDVTFAESLLKEHTRKNGNVSEKQAYWIGVLADRATGEVSSVPSALCAIPRLVGMLRKIRERAPKVRSPKIRLSVPEHDVRIVIRLASTGVVYINDADRRVFIEKIGKDRPVSYGSVAADSHDFVASRFADKALIPAIVEKLKTFEENPQKAAAVEGHATGACCFCGRHLDTAASVSAGYGPVCADRYALPWGEGSARNNLYDALDRAGLLNSDSEAK